MTVLSIAVRIPGRGEARLPIEFGDGGFERVVSVGSDPDCNVRLSAADVQPLHAFLGAASNHRYVEYVYPEEGYEPYRMTRFDDREIPIGPFRLRFVSRIQRTPPVRVAAKWRSRWSDRVDRILGLPPIDDPEIEIHESPDLAALPIGCLIRGALEPTLHPRGAMGRSRRVEIRLSDALGAELEKQSQRACQSPSSYASSCLETEFLKRSARDRRKAAEDCLGSHRFEIFAEPLLLEKLAARSPEYGEAPLSIEEAASRIVATRLLRRAQG